jgi:uncharacterized protein YidB (DUF937 family)
MASSDKSAGRFAGLRRASERIEAGQTLAVAADSPTSSGLDTLRSQLGNDRPARNATVRMSVEMSVEMHQQVSAIAARTGLPKAEVVRRILAETLPELL